MIKSNHVLATLSLAFLIGLWGCGNFDSTLSPAENSTAEPVGEITALSKPSSAPAAALELQLMGSDWKVIALIFSDGFESGNISFKGIFDSVEIPSEFPVIGRLRINMTRSGTFRMQVNVQGRAIGIGAVRIQFRGTGIRDFEGDFLSIGKGQVTIFFPDGTRTRSFEDITISIGLG